MTSKKSILEVRKRELDILIDVLEKHVKDRKVTRSLIERELNSILVEEGKREARETRNEKNNH